MAHAAKGLPTVENRLRPLLALEPTRVWEAALDEINEIHRKETAKSQPLLFGLQTHKVLRPRHPVTSVVLTGARKPRAGNAILWLIR